MKTIIKTGLATILSLSLVACSSPTTPTTEPTTNTTEDTTTQTTGTSVQFAVVYGAPHGTRGFGSAAVVINAEDGTIIDAFIDEYQYMDVTAEGVVGVPNSDGTFGEGAVEGMVLGSKRVNTTYYSAAMTENAGATVAIDANFDAIQDYAKGKTADELLGYNADTDTVTGATLADTAGYLALIAQAATEAAASTTYAVTSTTDVTIGEAEYAAHGDRGFALVADVLEGDTIVVTYIDEFQYFDSTADVTPVPNGDVADGLAGSFAEGMVLGSKLINSEYYSQQMAENGGATVALADNFKAIEDYAAGKTVTELTGFSADTDTVTGATLADTAGYIAAIANAATNSK